MSDQRHIPFLSAYLAQEERTRQQPMQEMQQAGAAMSLMGNMRKQALDQQYRAEIANAKTPEEQMQVAARYAGPEGLLKHADIRDRTAATKEATMQRIKQSAEQFDTRMALAYRQAQRQEEKDAIEAQWKQGRLVLETQAQRIAGERLFYDTGVRLPQPETPQINTPPAAPAAPTSALPPNVPPSDAAAYRAALAGGTATVDRMMPASEQANMKVIDLLDRGPPMAPGQLGRTEQPAPSDFTPVAAAPNNLDARDLRLQNINAGVSAPAQANAPQMPKFTGSPRQIAEAQNKWLASQAKGGEAGGKASETIVDAIVGGRMQPPTGFALRSPYWQDVMERVNAKDPKFDATKYGARAAAARTFASGPEARNVTALNTVIGHLGTLDEAAQALNNKDLRAFNAVANRMATEMGDPRIQNFDTARQAVAEETMRVFRQVGASEREAREWGDRISSAGSPAQLRGVIATLGELLDSRVKAIGQQYERTVNQGGNPARVDPENVKKLDKLREGAARPNSGFTDPEKERRYQEWKARQSK